jgi:hypothetical protein
MDTDCYAAAQNWSIIGNKQSGAQYSFCLMGFASRTAFVS